MDCWCCHEPRRRFWTVSESGNSPICWNSSMQMTMCARFFRAIFSGRDNIVSGSMSFGFIPKDIENSLADSSACSILDEVPCSTEVAFLTKDVLPMRLGDIRIVFTPFSKLDLILLVSCVLSVKLSPSTDTPNTNVFSINHCFADKCSENCKSSQLCGPQSCELFYCGSTFVKVFRAAGII